MMPRKPAVSIALLRLMRDHDRHAWTLDALQAGLVDIGLRADFSSVFRAAEKLVADGVAVKVLIDDGAARFELSAPHHDHLLCSHCDELIAVPCLLERDAFFGLEAETGVAVTEHRLILSGLCPGCRTEAAR
jgi:Fur family ferric uptake transcriptional regulator